MIYLYIPGEPRPYFWENAESVAVKGWLVFLGSMGPIEVPRVDNLANVLHGVKKMTLFVFLGRRNIEKGQSLTKWVNSATEGQMMCYFEGNESSDPW